MIRRGSRDVFKGKFMVKEYPAKGSQASIQSLFDGGKTLSIIAPGLRITNKP
jgi:hypothetical protein